MYKKYPEWLKNQQHTGSQYPYYVENKTSKMEFSFNMEDVLIDYPLNKRNLEISSVIEILHKGYIFGDKTLVQGINRSPWLGQLNNEGIWELKSIPKHGVNIPKSNISLNIKELLYDELLNYIEGFNKVGILLSGGLDSRIVAGILKEAQLKKDYNGDVVVYNWGMPQSRDVVYAEKIANLYDWEYVHYALTPEILKENFYNSLTLGAEISPIHLHRMSEVRDDTNTEIVIAGTYGDSLGRGLYSGTHVSNLKNLVEENLNKLGLIKAETSNQYESLVKADYYQYKNRMIDSKQSFQLREIEQNAHYLRRLLTTAMSIIAQKKPIYQMFTSPKLVEYVWDLDKKLRNDDIYKNILKTLPYGIGNLPYAKTGKSFIDNKIVTHDSYSKNYHKYGSWLRNDLRSFINDELDLDVLNSLGIFNEKSLEKIYRIWPQNTDISLNKIDNTISWLTLFSMFIKKNKLNNQNKNESNFKDRVNSMIVIPKIKGHQMKMKLTK